MIVTVGIDEAGRGSWAGPLVVAVVVLGSPIEGLADSKKINKKTREKLHDLILEHALAVSVGWASNEYIDSNGLTNAEVFAINQALENILIPYDEIIIDGKYNFLANNPLSRAVVDADENIPVVSAASIVAKVTRDQYMQAQSLIYPDYYFDKHVGYGTGLHMEMLKRFGPSKIHRLSYKPIQQLLKEKKA